MLKRLAGWLFMAILSFSMLNGSFCLVDDVHMDQHATHTPFCSIPHVPMSIPEAELNAAILENSDDSYFPIVKDEDIPELFLLTKPWRPPWLS